MDIPSFGAVRQSISEPSLPSSDARFIAESVTHCLQMQSGAADRNRTGTDFTPRDFKSLVSTCSTTAAYICTRVMVTHFPMCVKGFHWGNIQRYLWLPYTQCKEKAIAKMQMRIFAMFPKPLGI